MDLVEGNIETLLRVAVNCFPKNPIKNEQIKFALHYYTHIILLPFFGLSNDRAIELGFSCQVVSCLTPTEIFCVLFLCFKCLLQNIRHCTLNFQVLFYFLFHIDEYSLYMTHVVLYLLHIVSFHG